MRITKDQMFLDMASLVAKRGTCARAQVGCVLTNELGHVLSTGYNGTGRGLPHCITEECPGAYIPIGQGTGTCEAIHAEQNALLQCPDVMKIHTCYVTMAPCLDCTKLLLNTSCQWIIYLEEHPKMQASKDLWNKAKGPACFVSWDYLKDIREDFAKPASGREREARQNSIKGVDCPHPTSLIMNDGRTICGQCGYLFKPDPICKHYFQFNYIEGKWVCKNCGRIGPDQITCEHEILVRTTDIGFEMKCRKCGYVPKS